MDETMSEELLNIIINQHEKWLRGDPYGQRAIIEDKVISNKGMILDDHDLSYAVFRDCNLARVEFWETRFFGARFEGSHCTGSKFMYADMRAADLRDADFKSVQFDSCNLTGAQITGTRFGDNRVFDITMEQEGLMTIYSANRIVPETGGFTAWKKADEHLIKLTIPEDAHRIGGLAGPKCRVSYAYVESIQDAFNEQDNADRPRSVQSDYDPEIVYEIGQSVAPDYFDSRLDRDCTYGIHCFLDKEHALNF